MAGCAVCVAIFQRNFLNPRDRASKAPVPDFVGEIKGSKYICNMRTHRWKIGLLIGGAKNVIYVPPCLQANAVWNEYGIINSGDCAGMKSSYRVPDIDDSDDPEVFAVGSICDIVYHALHDSKRQPTKILHNLVIKLIAPSNRAWVVTNVHCLKLDRDHMSGVGSHVICVPLGCLRRAPKTKFQFVSGEITISEGKSEDEEDDEDMDAASDEEEDGDSMDAEGEDENQHDSDIARPVCMDAKDEIVDMKVHDAADIPPRVARELILAQKPLLEFVARNVSDEKSRLLVESQKRVLHCAMNLIAPDPSMQESSSDDETRG